MQYTQGDKPGGRAGAERAAGKKRPEGIVALSLVLPGPRSGGGVIGRARDLDQVLALCPFLALGWGSRAGEPGAVPGGRGLLALPWSEPRWWGWSPAGTPAAEGHAHGPDLAASQDRRGDGERTAPSQGSGGEKSLRLLLTLLPAVRLIERASPRPGPRAPFRWAVQPPVGLLPGLSPLAPPAHAPDGVQTPPAAPDRDLPPWRLPPGQVWRPAGMVPPGLPATAPVRSAVSDPEGTPGTRRALRDPTERPLGPRDRGPAPSAAPVVSGPPAAGGLPFGRAGALPGLAAPDAVRAVPRPGRGPAGLVPLTPSPADPGIGPLPVETPPGALGGRRRDGLPGRRWAQIDPFSRMGTGEPLPLPWPVESGGEALFRAARPSSPAEAEPGPYAPTAVRGLAVAADAIQAAERLVERRVRVEVARATRQVQAEVDEQLRARDRRAADEPISDEMVQGLMRKLRALVREERFREGRLR